MSTHLPDSDYIIEGDCDIYVAPTATALPTDLDTSIDGTLTFDASWIQLGFKDGGVKLNYKKTMNLEYVDEMEEAAKQFVVKAEGSLEFMIKQADADSFAYALDGIVTTQVEDGNKSIIAVGGGKPTYYRMFLHGLNDQAGYLCWDFFKVSNEGSFESQLKKGNGIVVPFKFNLFGDFTKPRGKRLFNIYNRDNT